MYSIIAENIHKTFDKGAITALDTISFSVKKGELFGMIAVSYTHLKLPTSDIV